MKIILLVDDEPPVLRLVTRILTAGGYTVLAASSAAEALAIAAVPELQIDLLLCDVYLPGMLGPDLASTLKKERPEMRVILMSGETGKALQFDVGLTNGWKFLGKPFKTAALLELVAAELSRPSALRAQG